MKKLKNCFFLNNSGYTAYPWDRDNTDLLNKFQYFESH